MSEVRSYTLKKIQNFNLSEIKGVLKESDGDYKVELTAGGGVQMSMIIVSLFLTQASIETQWWHMNAKTTERKFDKLEKTKKVDVNSGKVFKFMSQKNTSPGEKNPNRSKKSVIFLC